MRRMVAELFRARDNARPDGSIGAELELIPVRDATRRRVRIASDREGSGTAEIIRVSALAHSWREAIDAYGAPSWTAPDTSRISYEPGGQIEISSPVFPSPTDLEHSLRDTVSILRDAAGANGISLLSTGVDPYSEIEEVTLELRAPRYESMTRYFDSIGPSGVRMMRQTASLQVSVELGANPMERWTLLNALTPYLLAASVNSPIYAGQTTGYASYRAHLWQTLDNTRTGLPFDTADPVDAYTTFALHAGRILSDDAAHLTTLFPEIRPRGYFEIRSMDAMEPDRVGDTLRFIHAIIHRADVAAEARELIGDPDPELLKRAALLGRSDPLIDQHLSALESIV
jgi:glutamate--cysteine ligase